MSIKKIKGDSVAWVDAMRDSVAFTDEQRHKFEQIYKVTTYYAHKISGGVP